MTQNIQIEPDDYIYIASNVHNEAYVFGSVVQSGTLPANREAHRDGGDRRIGWLFEVCVEETASSCAGKCWEPGGESHRYPREVLRGNEKDLLLEPGDIVYVHQSPWAYAEEILDIAIKAYIQSATAVAIQGDNAVSIGL